LEEACVEKAWAGSGWARLGLATCLVSRVRLVSAPIWQTVFRVAIECSASVEAGDTVPMTAMRLQRRVGQH
jgi:hypothetical protein